MGHTNQSEAAAIKQKEEMKNKKLQKKKKDLQPFVRASNDLEAF